jgi:ribonuclease Z
VNLLYHEATFDKSKEELAAITGHSTTLDAAKTALDAGAGTLLIGHFSARYKEVLPLVEEARTIFPETYPAIDGKSFEVGNISEL